MHRHIARALLAAGTMLTAVAATLGAAAPAQAAPFLDGLYELNGTTHINSTNSDLVLGPGTLLATLDLGTGDIVGNMSLPSTSGSFKVIGLVPVEATVAFTETEPTTGFADPVTGATTTTSHVTIRITSLRILGIPQLIGHHCQTETPALIELVSEPGFNPILGGVVNGTYTIPDFENCLLHTGLINLLIPGDGNTISLTVGQRQVPPAGG